LDKHVNANMDLMTSQVDALACGRAHRERLVQLMNQKERVGDLFNQLRLALQRRKNGREAQVRRRTLL
jgi:hypothetical protein